MNLRRNWIWLALILAAVLVLIYRTAHRAGGTNANTPAIALTRVIQLPVSYVENGPSPRDRLGISDGGEDELPQGPSSFDVLPDGGVVLSDPLKHRIVYFDSEARFVKETLLDFTPREVAIASDGNVRVQSSAGKWLEEVAGGDLQETTFQPDAPLPETARLRGRDRGFVLGDTPGREEASGFPVLVSEGLASIEKLGRDARGRVYVGLEIPVAGDEVAVRKVIRKYAADGSALAQIGDVPLDYYVNPIREFRLKSDGKLYQLMPREGMVAINMWDTGRAP